LDLIDPASLVLLAAITAFAGFVKGAIGFAMPMILVSAYSAVLPHQTGLAILILPTLMANLIQAFRQGAGPALASAGTYWRHILMVVVFLAISAQFVTRIPDTAMDLILGVPVMGYALWQLAGRSLEIPLRHRARAEVVLGIIGGLFGGISGIWGPPLIVYLVSIHAPKEESVRVQGVVYLIGALVLLFAHLGSGVLNATTLPYSALACVPALLGMRVGFSLHDRLDPAQFRRLTLILLTLAGANLIRAGLLA
jgi:uncharacterized membrane protein YfcA